MFNNFKISNGVQNKNIFFVLGIIIFFALFYVFFLSPPADFPQGSIFSVERGNTLRAVSLRLKEEHLIRSRLFFEAFVILYGGEKHTMYSDYLFENKLPVYEIARRIAKGEHHMLPVVIAIPEGFDTEEIAEAAVPKLENFNETKFLAEAKELEGYLFPDTYFFSTKDSEGKVISSMRENFKKKISLLEKEILASGKSEQEIIIMASVIEREAKGNINSNIQGQIKSQTDRGFISGILWRRISLGIPLQVDAAPSTYKTKGLPKSPICNPGLESIKAAIHPENSTYLYYLHDKEGNIHYAKTFAEHSANIKKYLR